MRVAALMSTRIPRTYIYTCQCRIITYFKGINKESKNGELKNGLLFLDFNYQHNWLKPSMHTHTHF